MAKGLSIRAAMSSRKPPDEQRKISLMNELRLRPFKAHQDAFVR